MPANTLIAAFTLAVHGMALILLRAGWSPERGIIRLPFAVGLLTLLQAIVGWHLLYGAEFGTIYWFVSSSIGAWLCVAASVRQGLNTDSRTHAESITSANYTPSRSKSRRGSQWGKRSLRLAIAGPLTLICAVCISLLIARHLPFEPANAWVTAALSLPLLWAGGMILTVASERLLRHTLWTTASITATLPWLFR